MAKGETAMTVLNDLKADLPNYLKTIICMLILVVLVIILYGFRIIPDVLAILGLVILIPTIASYIYDYWDIWQIKK